MITNRDVLGAPDRLTALINTVYSAVPDAVILVAKITPAGPPNSADVNQLISNYNNQVQGAVDKSNAKAGGKVQVVDMQGGPNPVTIADLTDGTHPTDEGYRKMGDIWLAGMNNARMQGQIPSRPRPSSRS